MTTHYETLGVSDTADAETIKKSYRKLAMKWHPDRNQGNQEAEAKFKEISSAYEILGDEDKKREYDYQRQNPQSNNQWHQPHNMNSATFEDILSQVFGGRGFNPFTHQHQPRNKDIQIHMPISLEDAYFGKSMPIQFSINNRLVDIIVNIPPGIDNGIKIRYQGQGDNSIPSAPAGDLYVQIGINEHPIFTRRDSDLETSITIDAISAITGVKVKIPCIDGKEVDAVVPPGTQHNALLGLKNKGMPKKSEKPTFGDLLFRVKINIPTNLSNNDMKLLKEIQKGRNIDIIV